MAFGHVFEILNLICVANTTIVHFPLSIVHCEQLLAKPGLLRGWNGQLFTSKNHFKKITKLGIEKWKAFVYNDSIIVAHIGALPERS